MLERIEFVNRKNKLKLLSKKVRIAILTAALLLNTTASNTLIAFAAAEDSTDSEITVLRTRIITKMAAMSLLRFLPVHITRKTDALRL